MAKDRVTSRLACSKCKARNYTQVVTKKRKLGSLELKKYCPACRVHCVHKETK